MENPLDNINGIQRVLLFAGTSVERLLHLSTVNATWSEALRCFSWHLWHFQLQNIRPSRRRRFVFLAIERDLFWLLKLMIYTRNTNDSKEEEELLKKKWFVHLVRMQKNDDSEYEKYEQQRLQAATRNANGWFDPFGNALLSANGVAQTAVGVRHSVVDYAAKCGRVEMLQFLLSSDEEDGPALKYCTRRRRRRENKTERPSAGSNKYVISDDDDDDDFPDAPLKCAAENGHTACVKYLCEVHGASLNYAGGHTPLHAASRHGYEELVQYLLERGGRGGGREHREEGEEQKSKTSSSQSKIAMLNVGDRFGTPLMWASAAGHTKIVEMLLRAGADVHAGRVDDCCNKNKNKFNKEGKKKEEEDEGLCFSSTAKTNSSTSSSRTGATRNTALHYAAKFGRLQICRLLVGAGIDVYCKTDASFSSDSACVGVTAKRLAKKFDRADVAALLRGEVLDSCCWW